MVFVFRDFPGRGDISLSLEINNIIYIKIHKLHWNPLNCIDDDGVQAIMYIKYNFLSTCDLQAGGSGGSGEICDLHRRAQISTDLYEVINKILNKITLDLLGNNNNYRDFILIEDYDEINEIDIWNKNINENSYHSIWLPFTPENVKFLTIEDCDDITDPNFITIRGEINENLIFTYDAPIVSTNVDWSYYKKTRAH